MTSRGYDSPEIRQAYLGVEPIACITGEIDDDFDQSIFAEEMADPEDACDDLLEIDEHGAWRCQRLRDHEGPCWATAMVEIHNTQGWPL